MFCIEVWGDFALFTRPEMKVERRINEYIKHHDWD